jgi:hypothetical protein
VGVPTPAVKAAADSAGGAAALAQEYAAYVVAALAASPAFCRDGLARALTARALDLA